MDFYKKLITKIKPSNEEEKKIKKIAKEIIAKLKKVSGQEVVLVGSIAKGTALVGEGDIDIFLLFSKVLKKEEMKAKLEKIFKKAFPATSYQMNYAEHPYIKFHYFGKKIDIVPAYKISVGERLLTAVDRSVLHTKYILKNLKEKQKDEVRLLKKFLKTAGIYGAEIRVEGFSGYLCELLIIKYGSFLRLLKNAAQWNFPIVIDIEKYYKNKDYPALIKKFKKDFIVIDPVDKNRNVAAPLSDENLRIFVRLARSFLRKPSEKFFKGEKSFDEKIKALKKTNVALLIKLQRPEVVEDVLWGQIKKFINTLKINLSAFEVVSVVADASVDVKIVVFVKKRFAGGKTKIIGPPLSMRSHVKRFIESHYGSTFRKTKGRIVAITVVEKKDISTAIHELISKNAHRFSHLPLSNASVSLL